jgi:hypothetical protein
MHATVFPSHSMRNGDSDLAGGTNEINETKCELNMHL